MNSTDEARSNAERFLEAQAARDVEMARPLADPGFEVVSPGGKRTGLDALFERLRTAYRALEKRPDATDVVGAGDECVVYVHGTMAGERADGARFEGVRFLDRLVVRDGRIASQQIWNDFGQPSATSSPG